MVGGEAATARDGAFSTYTEIHAFVIGVALGVAAVLPVPAVRRSVNALAGLGPQCKRTGAIREAAAESWYALGGILLGLGLGLVLDVALILIVFHWAEAVA